MGLVGPRVDVPPEFDVAAAGILDHLRLWPVSMVPPMANEVEGVMSHDVNIDGAMRYAGGRWRNGPGRLHCHAV